MRRPIALLLCLSAVMAIPSLSLIGKRQASPALSSAFFPLVSFPDKIAEEELTFQVLNHETGKVFDIKESDYIKGVVAAEISSSYETEAIKAQAVAAHTYTLHRYIQGINNPNPSLKGAQLSTDPSICQAYISKEAFQEKQGGNFEAAYQKISDAVDQVFDCIMTYDQKPIVAAYHSMSGGKTEDAKTLWGSDVPYLKAVDSQVDTHQPQFQAETVFSKEEVEQSLKQKFPEIQLSDNPAQWFSIQTCSDSGTVETILVGDQTSSGAEIRSLFSLRSANFQVFYQDGAFHFITKGYGHGIGMSQSGANALAQQRYSYKDILSHYYTGISFTDRSEIVMDQEE